MKIVLASQSPRRKSILQTFHIPFEVVLPSFDEANVNYEGDPFSYTKELAEQKGKSLAIPYREKFVLTADTVVFYKEKVLEKPESKDHAFEMLSELNGNWHEVITAVCIHHENQMISDVEVTKVKMNALSSEQLSKYIEIFPVMDKAGSYGIQEGGALIVNMIKGCFYNVMGLPINTTTRLLKKAGYDAWEYLKKS